MLLQWQIGAPSLEVASGLPIGVLALTSSCWHAQQRRELASRNANVRLVWKLELEGSLGGTPPPPIHVLETVLATS